jgi:hypothetical protein
MAPSLFFKALRRSSIVCGDLETMGAISLELSPIAAPRSKILSISDNRSNGVSGSSAILDMDERYGRDADLAMQPGATEARSA